MSFAVGSHPSLADVLSKSDTSGALNFEGKAILNASGVNFLNGKSFAIAMDDLILDEELGRGNYGTVKKVIHKPTKVSMAMKVIWSSFYLLFILIQEIFSLGNKTGTRGCQTSRHHHGARRPPPRCRSRDR